MNEHHAWILPIAPQLAVAVGDFELRHIGGLDAAAEVPRAPRHCCELLLWRGRMLPLFDIVVWLGHSRVDRQASFAGVLAYRDPKSGDVALGTLKLVDTPQRVAVTAQQCMSCSAAGEQGRAWAPLARGFVRSLDEDCPLLDLAAMFTSTAAELAARGALNSSAAAPPAATVS